MINLDTALRWLRVGMVSLWITPDCNFSMIKLKKTDSEI